MISLGQPDLIKDSQTVYMHQITPHALCSAAGGVALKSPSFRLFALFRLPSKDLTTYSPSVSLPLTLFYNFSHWKPAPPEEITFLLYFLPTARGEKFDSWYCCIMKSCQQRSRPPCVLDLQFHFLSLVPSVDLALRSRISFWLSVLIYSFSSPDQLKLLHPRHNVRNVSWR